MKSPKPKQAALEAPVESALADDLDREPTKE